MRIMLRNLLHAAVRILLISLSLLFIAGLIWLRVSSMSEDERKCIASGNCSAVPT
jgi:hypothetical protein